MYKLNERLPTLGRKWRRTRSGDITMDDAEFALVAYGTSSRVCRSVVDKARAEGTKLGLTGR